MAFTSSITDQAPGDWWTQNAPPLMGPTPIATAGGPPASATTPQYGPGDPRGGTWTPQPGQTGTQTPPAAAAGGYSFPVPPGFDPSNPVDKLVLDQFQAGITKGLTDPGSQPTAANLSYWRNQINQTGGATTDNLAYWNTRMTSGQGGGGGGGAAPGGSGGGGFGPGEFAGYPTPYQVPTFTAPTDVTMQNDPGFQFRLEQGQKALQTAAAARGSLLSGGTLKALDRYTQDYASGEYGNVYNRALQGFTTNANLGLAGYQTNLGARQRAQEDYASNAYRYAQLGLNAAQGNYTVPPA